MWSKLLVVFAPHFPFVSQQTFQCCFLVGWYDVATWDNVKSTSKQCVSQRLNLHRRINVAYFSIDVNNVTQRRNNVAHFNVEFYNVDQHGNNVVKTTISNKKKMMMMNYFCGMVDQRKAFMPYLQPEPLSDILTIANLRHAASRVSNYAESEFRLCWMKLCSSDKQKNHFKRKKIISN